MDLPIVIDKDLLTPLHKQLTDAVRDAINTGRLAPKQALPSTRELAETLAISRRTVVRSYNDLISQGFLETTFGGGTFVSGNPPVEAEPAKESASLAQVDMNVLSQFARQLLRSEHEIVDFGNYSPFNYCGAPADMLPIKQWRQILSKHCTITEPMQLDYVVEVFGYRPLREQICRFLRRSKGLQCDVDQLVATVDTQTALDLVARVLINPGDIVVLENPGYFYLRELFIAYGAKIHTVSIDEEGLIVDQLKNINERCKLICVTPSHQDPTGAQMSMPRRQALLAWAKENCEFILEDAFDSDYFYSTAPLPALHGLDQNNQVIYLYNFWKMLFPLMTSGYLVVPPALIEAFARTKQHVNRFFPTLEQRALNDFISEGHLERHWHKTRAVYKKRRQALIFALTQTFRGAINFFGDGSGLHLTVRFDLPISDEDLLDCAEIAGIQIISSQDYYFENPVPHEFLIPFSSVPDESATELVNKFAQTIREKSALLQK